MECGYAQGPTDIVAGMTLTCLRLLQPQLIHPQMPHITTFPGRSSGTMLTATDIGAGLLARATHH